MNDEDAERVYADIINLPPYRSDRHAPMPVRERAAQFSSFAALHGHNQAIDEATQESIRLSDARDAVVDES